MLQLFSKNHFLSSLLFLPIIFILHLSVFFREEVYTLTSESGGYLGFLVTEWFTGIPVWGGVVCCLFIFIQVILLNRMNIINKLGNRITLYTGMAYMVLTMMFPEFLIFSPALLGAGSMLLAITNVMYAYKINQAPKKVFNAGFWIGVSSLFYPTLAIFYIWGFISFFILRRFRSVESLRYLIGFLVPYIWILIGVYIWGDMSYFLEQQFFNQYGFPELSFEESFTTYIPVLLFGLLIIFALLNYGQYMKKKVIQSQKKISILYWFMAFSGITALFTQQLDITHFFILCIPISYFLSETLIIMDNKGVAELIMWLFILIGCVFQYGILL